MSDVGSTRVSSNRKWARALGTLGLGALTMVASPLAVAADPGWYVGANLGQSRAKIDDGRIVSGLKAEGYATNTISNHDHDTGYKLFGGYQFNKYFAVESGYFNLGKFSYTATTTPPGALSADIKVQGLNVDAVGIWPITPQFAAFGRAGLIYADARDAFTGTGALYASSTSLSKRAWGYKYGIGVQYAFNPTVAMRAEAERYRINDAVGNKGDIDLISVGLVYHFGDTSRSDVVPVPVTENDVAPYVAPAPAAQPAVKPAVKLVTLDDTYFRFGKASLTEKGKRVLKQNIQTLNQHPNMNIRIAGYTSASGTAQYNQALSERRARSVRNYLVREGGIAPDRLTTIGYGKTRPAMYEPIPSNTESKAARANMRVLFEIVVR